MYESITFIFTDLWAMQAWFGHCQLPKDWHGIFEGHSMPPAFPKYARGFELSLDPDFGRSVQCGNEVERLPVTAHPHEGYDFHWLHLSRFENLRTVNIWVGARSKTIRLSSQGTEIVPDVPDFVFGIKELDPKTFARLMSAFEKVDSVTISTPLGPSFEPEEGRVTKFPVSNVRLYKRGTGDRFHPLMSIISGPPWSHHDRLIHTSGRR